MKQVINPEKYENINPENTGIDRLILVVDDDEGINRLAQKVLRRAGFNCRGVLNGTEAIEAVKKEKYPVLMLDHKLPDMTGTELVSTLINLGYDIPFVAMTGHGDEKIAVEMMKLGARDYLVKGFDLSSILPMVFDRLFHELDTEYQLAETEKRLKRHQALYKSLLESTKAVAYEINLISNHFTYISPRIADLTGYAHEQWTDIDFRISIVHPEDKDECIRICRDEVKKGKDLECEYRIMTAANKILWVKDIISLVKTEDTPVVMRGFLVDITRQKMMETQLQQKQKMESIGILAGGIAHDFNNILFPIVGYSEMLLEDLPHKSPEYESVTQILKAGIRGSDLVKQILSFSRRQENLAIPIRIELVVKEALKLIRSTIPANIEIRERFQIGSARVKADATQIHQVVMNLLTNAFHAVEKTDGSITVGLEKRKMKQEILQNQHEAYALQYPIENMGLPPGEYIALFVSDTGIGMPFEVKKQIFEPYFTTKDKGKGTGLGLSVVYGIVKQHGGDIKVESQEGEGTTITIYLPLIPQAPRAMETQTTPGTQVSEGRVLVVDDETDIARLQQMILERLGYQTQTVNTPLEALTLFKADPHVFDLVLTDMSMPRMTGDRLAKEIKKIRPEIPIIVCTGFSDRLNKEEAKAIGVSGFLMKPVRKAELSSLLGSLLRNR